MSLYKKLTYIRLENDGIHHIDSKTKLWHSVTFTLFDQDIKIATLITNNSKTYTNTNDNIQLSLKKKWYWNNKCNFRIIDHLDSLVAFIDIHRPALMFFKSSTYKITFPEDNTTYLLKASSSKELKELNAVFCYHFLLDNQVRCSITNYEKPPLLYNPVSTKLKGEVCCKDEVGLAKILGFLQLMNIYIDLEFDI